MCHPPCPPPAGRSTTMELSWRLLLVLPVVAHFVFFLKLGVFLPQDLGLFLKTVDPEEPNRKSCQTLLSASQSPNSSVPPIKLAA